MSIAFEHILAGENEILKDESLQSGTVSISSSEIALHCTLLPVLKEFHSLYPKVKIRVSNHTTPQAIQMLRNGFSNLAIVTTPLGPTKSLKHQVIQEIQEIPVCSIFFSDLIGSTLTWTQLSQLPIICLGKNTNSYAFFSSVFSENGIPFEPDIEAATADQIIPLVKSNLGIGFVPLEFLNSLDIQNDIMVPQLDHPIPKRQICLLKRADANLDIATMELEKMILNRSLQFSYSD